MPGLQMSFQWSISKYNHNGFKVFINLLILKADL